MNILNIKHKDYEKMMKEMYWKGFIEGAFVFALILFLITIIKK